MPDPRVRELWRRFEAVRLDTLSDTRALTPSGTRMTAGEWADSLDLLRAPAPIFFDEHGKEVLRVDWDVMVDARGKIIESNDPSIAGSIAKRLQYVLEKVYLTTPRFQQWQRRQMPDAIAGDSGSGRRTSWTRDGRATGRSSQMPDPRMQEDPRARMARALLRNAVKYPVTSGYAREIPAKQFAPILPAIDNPWRVIRPATLPP